MRKFKTVLTTVLAAVMAVTCMGLIACGDKEEGAKPYFDSKTVFHLDLTMSTAIGPLSDLCNPGTLTFGTDGKADMNITFTDSAKVMMDTLLGFRIADFVHTDSYELNEDKTQITYHSTRKNSDTGEFTFGDMEIAIEYLSDGSMKFTFDVGKAIPQTVLYFYSNKAMMPSEEEPDPTPSATYKVSYDAGGGTLEEGFTLPEETEYDDVTVITLPEAKFSKDGHIFRGWAVNGVAALGLYQPGATYTLKGEVTFVALWDETVVFTFTDGNGLTQKLEAQVGESITLPNCVFASNDVKKGFAYWLQDGSTIKKYPGTTILASRDMVITAVFTDLITLTFQPGTDGQGNPFKVKIPAYSLYIWPECTYTYSGAGNKGFGGWMIGEKTTVYKPGAKYTSFTVDSEMKAAWKDYVTISFDANDAQGTLPEAISVVSGMDFVLPTCALTAPENTRFGGWSTAKGKTTGLKQPGDTASQTKNTTYYALWDVKRTVSFNTGIEGKTIDPIQQYERDKIALPEMPYENGELRFAGWTTSAKKDTAISGDAAGKAYTVPAGSDTELFAVWNKKVDVTFAGGDGATGSMETLKVYENDKISPECTFEKDGYIFSKWQVNGKDIRLPYTVPKDGTTLTATWVAKVTLKFVGGEGATGSTADLAGATGTKIILPECGFTKDGYLFGGWRDSEGNTYQAGVEITLPTTDAPQTLTFTATWNQGNPYADYMAIFRAGQTSETVYTGVTLNNFFPGGSMTELVLRPNLTADFIIKSKLSEKDFNTHNTAGNLGLTYAKFQETFNVEYRGITYDFNKETNTVTLNLGADKTLDIVLKKVAKNDKIGYDSVQFEYTLSNKLGAIEKLTFAAIDGKPTYLTETTTFEGAIPDDAPSFGGTKVSLTVNTDGTGKLRASILTLNFTHQFTADYKTIIWLGDEGDRLEGSAGRTDDGKMTVSVTLLGVTITLAEQV